MSSAGVNMVKRHHHRHNLRNRFQITKTLGQGTYGKVKLAVEKSTGLEYAIKSIRKSQISSRQDLSRIRREIEIMASLSHPHIISVHEVFENKEKIVLVLDHASGGELYDHINDNQGLFDYQARKYFRQIASAVHYLHQNGIVHRDLKLENIMLDSSGNAVIGDFGLANLHHRKRYLHTFCGSPLYASPEIVNGLPYRGPEVDCWSLGVLLYTLVYGAMPFDGSDFKRLRRQITNGEFYEPANPSDAAGLIRKLLTVDPSERATIEDICSHWWVNLGYTSTPDQQSPQGRPVNYKLLENSLNSAVTSDSDDPLSGLVLNDVRNNGDVSPEAKPLKGILKKPKDFSPKFAKSITDQIDKVSRSKHHGGCEQGTAWTSRNGDESESASAGSSPEKNGFHSGSSQKPRRGILKNSKHKYTGADSGCIIEDINVTDYFSSHADSVESAASYEDEETEPSCYMGDTTNSLQTSGSADHLDEEDYELDDIEAVLDELDLGETDEVCCGAFGMERTSEHASIVAVDNDEACRADTCSVGGHNYVIANDNQNAPCDTQDACPGCNHDNEADNAPGWTTESLDSDNTDLSNSTDSNLAYSSDRSPPITSTPAGKLKGILKRRGKYAEGDPVWRLSADSTGSTSSTDALDISYDSEDDGMRHRIVPAWEPPDYPISEHSFPGDEGLGEDQSSWLEQEECDAASEEDDFSLSVSEYYEEGIHRNVVTADLFDRDEARIVAQQATEICSTLTMA